MNPYHRVDPATGIEYIPAPGDQSVYCYLGDVLIGHFSPTATWNLRAEKGHGVYLDVFDIGPSGVRMRIKSYPPGEWATIKRGAD